MFLKGKCAYCKKSISIQYPIIELIAGIGFLVAYCVFGLTLKTLFICLFFALFIILSATDIKECVVIDYHTYILAILALIYSFLNLGDINGTQAIIGAIFGFAFFEIMAWIGKIFAKHRMFGEGDSLIAIGLGAIFGIKGLIIVIALSFVIQSISAIPILINNAIKNKKKQLAISYCFVFIGLIFLFLIKNNQIIQNDYLYLSFVILLTVSMLFALKNILAEIKQKSQNKETQKEFCLLPFGPALLISATICIFYLQEIKEYVLSFIA